MNLQSGKYNEDDEGMRFKMQVSCPACGSMMVFLVAPGVDSVRINCSGCAIPIDACTKLPPEKIESLKRSMTIKTADEISAMTEQLRSSSNLNSWNQANFGVNSMQYPPFHQPTQNQSLSALNQNAADLARTSLFDYHDVANRLQSISNRDLSSVHKNRSRPDVPNSVPHSGSNTQTFHNSFQSTKPDLYQDLLLKQGRDQTASSKLETPTEAKHKKSTKNEKLSEQLELSKRFAMEAFENSRMRTNEKQKSKKEAYPDLKARLMKTNGTSHAGNSSQTAVGSAQNLTVQGSSKENECPSPVITIEDSDEEDKAVTSMEAVEGLNHSTKFEMQDYVVICPHPKCQQKITGKVERGTIGVQRITCPYCDCKIDCVHDTRSNNEMEPKKDPRTKEDRAAAQQTLVDIDSGLLDEPPTNTTASSILDSRIQDRISLQPALSSGISIEQYSSMVQSHLQKCFQSNYAAVAANKLIREPLPPLPSAVPMEQYLKSVLSNVGSLDPKSQPPATETECKVGETKENETDANVPMVMDSEGTTENTCAKISDNAAEKIVEDTTRKISEKDSENNMEKTSENVSGEISEVSSHGEQKEVKAETKETSRAQDVEDANESMDVNSVHEIIENAVDIELGDDFVENLLVSWGIIRRTANILQLPDLDMEAFLLAIHRYDKQGSLKTYVDDLHISLLKELCKEFRRPEHHVRNISALNVHTWHEGLRFYILWMSRNIYVALIGCRKDECNEKHDSEESNVFERPEADDARERMNSEMSSSAERLQELATKLWEHPYTDLKLDDRFVILRFLCERLLQMYDVRKELEEEESQGHLMKMTHKEVLKAMLDEEVFVFPERNRVISSQVNGVNAVEKVSRLVRPLKSLLAKDRTKLDIGTRLEGQEVLIVGFANGDPLPSGIKHCKGIITRAFLNGWFEIKRIDLTSYPAAQASGESEKFDLLDTALTEADLRKQQAISLGETKLWLLIEIERLVTLLSSRWEPLGRDREDRMIFRLSGDMDKVLAVNQDNKWSVYYKQDFQKFVSALNRNVHGEKNILNTLNRLVVVKNELENAGGEVEKSLEKLKGKNDPDILNAKERRLRSGDLHALDFLDVDESEETCNVTGETHNPRTHWRCPMTYLTIDRDMYHQPVSKGRKKQPGHAAKTWKQHLEDFEQILNGNSDAFTKLEAEIRARCILGDRPSYHKGFSDMIDLRSLIDALEACELVVSSEHLTTLLALAGPSPCEGYVCFQEFLAIMAAIMRKTPVDLPSELSFLRRSLLDLEAAIPDKAMPYWTKEKRYHWTHLVKYSRSLEDVATAVLYLEAFIESSWMKQKWKALPKRLKDVEDGDLSNATEKNGGKEQDAAKGRGDEAMDTTDERPQGNVSFSKEMNQKERKGKESIPSKSRKTKDTDDSTSSRQSKKSQEEEEPRAQTKRDKKGKKDKARNTAFDLQPKKRTRSVETSRSVDSSEDLEQQKPGKKGVPSSDDKAASSEATALSRSKLLMMNGFQNFVRAMSVKLKVTHSDGSFHSKLKNISKFWQYLPEESRSRWGEQGGSGLSKQSKSDLTCVWVRLSSSWWPCVLLEDKAQQELRVLDHLQIPPNTQADTVGPSRLVLLFSLVRKEFFWGELHSTRNFLEYLDIFNENDDSADYAQAMSQAFALCEGSIELLQVVSNVSGELGGLQGKEKGIETRDDVVRRSSRVTYTGNSEGSRNALAEIEEARKKENELEEEIELILSRSYTLDEFAMTTSGVASIVYMLDAGYNFEDAVDNEDEDANAIVSSSNARRSGNLVWVKMDSHWSQPWPAEVCFVPEEIARRNVGKSLVLLFGTHEEMWVRYPLTLPFDLYFDRFVEKLQSADGKAALSEAQERQSDLKRIKENAGVDSSTGMYKIPEIFDREIKLGAIIEVEVQDPETEEVEWVPAKVIRLDKDESFHVHIIMITSKEKGVWEERYTHKVKSCAALPASLMLQQQEEGKEWRWPGTGGA